MNNITTIFENIVSYGAEFILVVWIARYFWEYKYASRKNGLDPFERGVFKNLVDMFRINGFPHPEYEAKKTLEEIKQKNNIN